jgi:hypothetical protein
MIGTLQKGIEWLNPSNTLAAQTYMIIFIIIFIQFRPRGIIALKGRAAGDCTMTMCNTQGSPRAARGAHHTHHTMMCHALSTYSMVCTQAPALLGGGKRAPRPLGREVQLAGDLSHAA